MKMGTLSDCVGDAAEEAKAVLANLLVVNHDENFVEVAVDGTTELVRDEC